CVTVRVVFLSACRRSLRGLHTLPYTTLFRSWGFWLSPCGTRCNRQRAACCRICNLCGCAFLRRNPYRKASPTKGGFPRPRWGVRSEEHTSELQSRYDLV